MTKIMVTLLIKDQVCFTTKVAFLRLDRLFCQDQYQAIFKYHNFEDRQLFLSKSSLFLTRSFKKSGPTFNFSVEHHLQRSRKTTPPPLQTH